MGIKPCGQSARRLRQGRPVRRGFCGQTRGSRGSGARFPLLRYCIAHIAGGCQPIGGAPRHARRDPRRPGREGYGLAEQRHDAPAVCGGQDAVAAVRVDAARQQARCAVVPRCRLHVGASDGYLDGDKVCARCDGHLVRRAGQRGRPPVGGPKGGKQRGKLGRGGKGRDAAWRAIACVQRGGPAREA